MLYRGKKAEVNGNRFVTPDWVNWQELMILTGLKMDQHYGHPNGVSGTDIFRNAMKIIRPTYLGYHGYMGEWLSDNPELTKEFLNLSDYWYFPKSISTTQYKKGELSFEIEWLNKGLAPSSTSYLLKEI